jgi:hypothetical protein
MTLIEPLFGQSALDEEFSAYMDPALALVTAIGREPSGRLMVVIAANVWKVVNSLTESARLLAVNSAPLLPERNDSLIAPAPVGWVCRLVSPDTSI